jgi:hypothetical protein
MASMTGGVLMQAGDNAWDLSFTAGLPKGIKDLEGATWGDATRYAAARSPNDAGRSPPTAQIRHIFMGKSVGKQGKSLLNK